MDTIMQNNQGAGSSKRIMWIVMLVGALVIAALVAWAVMTPSQRQETPRLENALREGPEFEELKRKIVVETAQDFTTEARSMTSGVQMNLVGVVRNFTQRPITGLEVVGSVVDKDGNVVKEKSLIAIPTRLPRLEPNRTMPIQIQITGFDEKDDRSNIKWRITGIKVE